MHGPNILALDIGTSGIRAAVYDGRAQPVPGPGASVALEPDVTPDGGSELDADICFSKAVSAIDGAMKNLLPEIETPGFAAVSSFWHSLLGIDKHGRPTTKVFTWAETRAAPHARRIREKIDEAAVHNRTGCAIHSSYWPAKLVWLRETDPAAFGRTDKWVSFSDFLYLRFFGSLGTSVSMASATGIFDIRKIEWDGELLAFLGISNSALPEVAEDRAASTLKTEYSERWPALKNTKWFHAVGDGAANNIGADCVTKNSAALMIGSSGAMRVAYEGDAPDKIPDGLWCYRIDRKRVIVGGALSDGGNLFGWLRRNLRLPENDSEISRLLAKRAPDSHCLTFLPFLYGERSTGYHDDAKGAVLGLNASHDGGDILRAAFESVAYRFAEIHDRLRQISDIGEIVISGGALAASNAWPQILADVIGEDLQNSGVKEASSRGAVILALEAVGTTESVAPPVTGKREMISFNKADHAIYGNARRRHERLYKLLIDG